MLFWSQQGACSNSAPALKRKRSIAHRGLGALAILSCAGAVVRAQDLPPGLLATFDISQRLEYSDNPDLDLDDEADSDIFGRTILGFGLESVTSIQSFRLNLGTELEEFQDENDQSFDFTNSFGTLNYTRATRNASVGADLRYRETDVDGEFFDEDFAQDGDIITQDDGTRVSFGFTLRGTVGEDAPVGARFDWAYNEINFEDTDDPSLNDSQLNDIDGQIDFRINPRVTLSLTAGYNDFETEDPDGTDRETTRLGLATEFEVSPILTMNVGLSYEEIERTGGTEQTDNGISADVDLTRDLPNGTIGLRFASEVFANEDGRRSFFSVSRDMDLPRGALGVTLGVTGSDVVGTDPLIEADYRYDLPAGQLTFGISQRVVVDDEDNEDINTTLRAAYDQQINRLSSFGFNVGLFDRNALDDDGDDGQRIEIGFSYRYDLTRDWGLVSGITYTTLSDDDDDDRDRTTLFVGVQRSFNWIP